MVLELAVRLEQDFVTIGTEEASENEKEKGEVEVR
jgi:hypothetical protein